MKLSISQFNENVKNDDKDNSLRDNEILDKEQIDKIIKDQFGSFSRTNDFKNNILGDLSEKLNVAYTLMTDRSTFEDGKAGLENNSAFLYIILYIMKKETSQLINAKSPNATPKSGSVVVSNTNISQNDEVVNSSISKNAVNDFKKQLNGKDDTEK